MRAGGARADAGRRAQEMLMRVTRGAGWVAREYARAVPRPRAVVIADEIFKSGAFPGDTGLAPAPRRPRAVPRPAERQPLFSHSALGATLFGKRLRPRSHYSPPCPAARAAASLRRAPRPRGLSAGGRRGRPSGPRAAAGAAPGRRHHLCRKRLRVAPAPAQSCSPRKVARQGPGAGRGGAHAAAGSAGTTRRSTAWRACR